MNTSTNNPFSLTPNTESDDYHLFSSNHPYMASLGLSVFTTGTLFSWWTNTSSYNKDSLPEMILPEGDVNWGKFLGIDEGTNFSWNGWKNSLDVDNFGTYETQGLNGFSRHEAGDSWFHNNKFLGVSLDYSDLNPILKNVSNGGDGDLRIVTGGTIATEGSDNFQLGDFKPIFSKLSPADNPKLYKVTFKPLGPILDLIVLNRYMVAFEGFFPPSSWDINNLENKVGGVRVSELIAARELLTEIKASQRGSYLEWSEPVTFKVASVGQDCLITENIPFKLYLFDKATSPNKSRGVALRDLTFVAPKKTITGKTYGETSDAGYTPEGDTPVAAPLDMHYNEAAGKWEAGTRTILARLVTPVGTASQPPVEKLLNGDVSESLVQNPIIASTGMALPVFAQNGNPLQFQPNYAKPRCGESQEDKSKETLTVYNYSSNRSYNEGESVNLTFIDNHWSIIPLDLPPPEDDFLNNVDGLNWGEFTYMMTNSNFFFINAENYNPESPYGNAPPGTPALKFNPRQAELHFHYDYYAGSNFYPDTGADNSFIRDLNAGYNYGDLGGYNGRFNTEAIKNSTVWDRLSLFHAYCQVTSFDFLDSQIFGLRGYEKKSGALALKPGLDKCSIAYTDANKDSSGRNIIHPQGEYATRNAAHCGIFFGCLFPDGYRGFENYLFPRDFSVGSLDLFGEYIKSNEKNSTSFSFPFQDSEARNNCRQATVGSKQSPTFTSDDLAWSRAKDELSYTLFHNQELLDSVPADVMLNASPSGFNGSPIYPVHRFKFMHKPNFNKTERNHVNYLQEVKDAFNAGKWLYKFNQQVDLFNSAFDFKPNNPNHIMFRPLKMEAYTQFLGSGQNVIDAAKDTSKQDTADGIFSNFGRRLMFLCEGYRTQFDYTMPVAFVAFEREIKNNREHLRDLKSDYADNKPYLFSFWGLEWGGELVSRPTYRNIHRGSYWGGTRESFNLGFPEGAMKWTRNQAGIKDWTGAGAYGIITTSKTVAAKKAITITTDNRYGMGAQAAGTFSIAGGHSQQYRTWGVPSFSNSYRQENIHDLSVRIYQHHPKNQTLFDPRTFAVHHFNPGVEIPLPNDQLEKRRCTETSASGKDKFGKRITFKYKQCRPINSVDMQVPSAYVAWPDTIPDGAYGADRELHQNSGNYVAKLLDPGTLVYSDATYLGKLRPPVINEKFWVFDGMRIGKLLPFRYLLHQIGVPVFIGQVISFGDGMIFASELSPYVQPKTNLVVINQGANYAVGDIIGSSQYNVEFRVEQLGPGGQVLKLKCLNPGKIKASDAAKHTDVFGPNSIGPIRIRDTKSGSGGGFSAYYTVARLNVLDKIDPKPKLITSADPVRVASDVSQPRHATSGPNSSIESLAIVEDTKSTEFLITDDNKSSDNRYDIFFHFHNDITMTWLASNQDFHGDRNNAAEAVEQFISARITVT
jgi:hypothetical protein